MLKNSWQTIPNWIAIAFLVVSFAGFVDAAYLTVEHFQGNAPNCGEYSGCETVTTSEYSKIAGVPVALLGVFYYLTMLALAVTFLDRRDKRVLRLASWLSIAGLVASVVFVALQLFVIEAVCLYCMGSALTSTLLFILGMIVLQKTPRGEAERSS